MYEPKDNVNYAHREYPKWVYKGKDGIIVQDEDEHDAAKAKGYGSHGSAPVVEDTIDEPEEVIAEDIVETTDKPALEVVEPKKGKGKGKGKK